MRGYPFPLPALVRKYQWLAAQHGPDSPQAQAARGRMNARMGRHPASNDESPAAVAARRAHGQRGHLNRSYRWAEALRLARQYQATLAGQTSLPDPGDG